jgi:regulator of replication initiation timing
MGRPVKTNVETPEEVERLRVENQELRHRLRAMEVSLDVAMILSSESTATGKKTTEGALSQRLPR